MFVFSLFYFKEDLLSSYPFVSSLFLNEFLLLSQKKTFIPKKGSYGFICSFLLQDARLVYKHFATLYFVFIFDSSENELAILDLIQGRFLNHCLFIGIVCVTLPFFALHCVKVQKIYLFMGMMDTAEWLFQ